MNQSSPPGRRPALTPYQLGNTRLRNRIVLPAHTTNFAVPGENLVTDRYVDYLAARARGGVGLVVTEGIRVHPTTLRVSGLAGYQPNFDHGIDRLAAAMHAEGAALYGQVLHSGRHVAHAQLHAVGASDVPWSAGATPPHALYAVELDEMVESYRRVTERLAATDIDGLELHLGHGHLLQQFLSPLTNRRDDEYGGGLEGRLRFPKRVLEAVLSSGAPVGIRISAEEFSAGGLGIEQMLEVLDRLVPHYPLSYVHVSHSVYDGGLSMATQMADMSHDATTFRDLSKAVKSAFPEVPVMTVCRVDTLDAADGIVREGQADLVGMARAHIADPDLVSKSAASRTSEVRSCLYCNQGCAGHIEKGLPITCVVNPIVGLERSWPGVANTTVAPAPTSVAVVGGGPAGMEAAMAAAARGHRVRLHEREPQLGGAVLQAARLGGRQRFGLLAIESAAKLERSTVEILLGSAPTASDLLAARVEHVVVATGAVDRPPPLPGCDHVLAPGEAIDQLAADALGTVVVLIDEDGGWAGSGLAVDIARSGREVHLVVPAARLAWNVTMYSRPPLVRDLGQADVTVHLLRRPARLRAGQLTLTDTVSGRAERLDGVTDVIWAGCRHAEDTLARVLLADGYDGQVHVVGDAYAPRTALEAVYDGHLTGAMIGVDPTVDAPPHRPGMTARSVVGA